MKHDVGQGGRGGGGCGRGRGSLGVVEEGARGCLVGGGGVDQLVEGVGEGGGSVHGLVLMRLEPYLAIECPYFFPVGHAINCSTFTGCVLGKIFFPSVSMFSPASMFFPLAMLYGIYFTFLLGYELKEKQ